MGILNAHSFYCAFTAKLQAERDALFLARYGDIYTLAAVHKIAMMSAKPKADSKVIVNNLFLHATALDGLLSFFKCVLEVCQKYSVTINLKKCRFLPKAAEFVGIDVTALGNQPARSKFEALDKLKEILP